MFEFDPRVRCCEVSICLGMIGTGIVFPGGDFVDEGLFVRDAAVEAPTG